MLNPCLRPYGPLSNIHAFRMTLDKEQWSTVSQYIYSNMIDDPFARAKLKKQLSRSESQCDGDGDRKEFQDGFKQYTYQRHRSDDALVSQALETGLKVKYADPEVMAILLKTNNATLEYTSSDALLGMGEDGKGQNLVGKYSMQMRDEYRKLIEGVQTPEEKDRLYAAYIAYTLLKQLIQEEGNDLSVFEPGNAGDIRINKVADLLAIYVSRGGPPELSSERAVRVASLKGDEAAKAFFFERGADKTEIYQVAVKSPFVIVAELRKLYLEGLSRNRLVVLRDKAMGIYIDSLLEANYPELSKSDYAQAKEEQLGQISADEYYKLGDSLLQHSQNLPVPLARKIADLKKQLAFIAPNVIANAERFDLSDVVRAQAVDEQVRKAGQRAQLQIIKIAPGKPDVANGGSDLALVKIQSFQALSPLYFTGVLEIDGLGFPSVMHYVMARKFASLWSVKDLMDAFPYILRQPSSRFWQQGVRTEQWDKLFVRNFALFENIDKVFREKRKEEDAVRLRELARKALNEKFENRALQNLLLSTENARLVWNSKDYILGSGDSGSGENFVGKYLEQLRTLIFDRQAEENRIFLTADNLYAVLGDDQDIKLWMERKVGDIIQTARKLISYSKAKFQVTLPLSAKLIKIVMREIMHWDIHEIPGIRLSTPAWFPVIVWKFVNSKSRETPEIIMTLWSHIAVALQYFILGNDNASLSDLKTGLLKLEDLLSVPFLCQDIFEDNEESCILVALVNILRAMVGYNKQSAVLLAKTAYVTEEGALAEVENQTIPTEPRITIVDVATAVAVLTKTRSGEGKEEDLADIVIRAEERLVNEPGEAEDETRAEEEYDPEAQEDFEVEESEAEEEEEEKDDGAGSNDMVAVSSYLQTRPDLKYEVRQRGGELITRSYVAEPWGLTKVLIEAVNNVKNNRTLSRRVLQNRINFFATLA